MTRARSVRGHGMGWPAAACLAWLASCGGPAPCPPQLASPSLDAGPPSAATCARACDRESTQRTVLGVPVALAPERPDSLLRCGGSDEDIVLRPAPTGMACFLDQVQVDCAALRERLATAPRGRELGCVEPSEAETPASNVRIHECPRSSPRPIILSISAFTVPLREAEGRARVAVGPLVACCPEDVQVPPWLPLEPCRFDFSHEAYEEEVTWGGGTALWHEPAALLPERLPPPPDIYIRRYGRWVFRVEDMGEALQRWIADRERAAGEGAAAAWAPSPRRTGADAGAGAPTMRPDPQLVPTTPPDPTPP